MRLAWLTAVTLAATGTAQGPVPVMAGDRVVDPESGEVLRRLPSGGHTAEASLSVSLPSAFLVGDRIVDVADRSRSFLVTGGHVEARDGDEKPVWSRALAALDARRDTRSAQCCITADLLVVPTLDGGLCALRRSDGEPAWRRPRGPNTLLAIGDALVFSAGPVGDDGRIEVWADSLRNGAHLFDMALGAGATPQRIVPSDDGAAVLCADRLVALDPMGPRRFEVEGKFLDVVATRAGFIARREGELVAWDRDGAERWRAAFDDDGDRLEMWFLTPSVPGDAILLSWCGIADSGVRVRRFAAQDGALAFDRSCAPLGVGHSKYRHRAFARVDDDRLILVSQASGGAFVEALDLRSGAAVARHVLER